MLGMTNKKKELDKSLMEKVQRRAGRTSATVGTVCRRDEGEDHW